MQYAFAYYYYLMSVEHPFNATREFEALDADDNGKKGSQLKTSALQVYAGILSVHELRTLVTRLYNLPTTPEDWNKFELILLNCSDGQEPMEELGVGVGPNAKEVISRQPWSL